MGLPRWSCFAPGSAGSIMRLGFCLWVRKISGGGHGSPLQYSCLENRMDRGAWRATVCGVAQSRTQSLSLSSSSDCLHFTGPLISLGLNLLFIFSDLQPLCAAPPSHPYPADSRSLRLLGLQASSSSLTGFPGSSWCLFLVHDLKT